MNPYITRATLIVTVFSLSACGVGYRNGKQCEAKMLETYPTQEPAITIQHTASSYKGIRVIVEATYQVAPKVKQQTLLTVKTIPAPAAVECTFDVETMTGFKWVSPEKMVTKPDPAAAEQ